MFRLPTSSKSLVINADNLTVLHDMPANLVDLIYIDPPFNTGKTQNQTRIKTVQSPEGDRVGFQGRRYSAIQRSSMAFDDRYEDYLAFLEPRLRQAYRVLKPNGSLYLHCDYREVHRIRFLLEEMFGAESFKNELIWAFDYGGKPKDRWPAKHQNILFFVKDPNHYTFNVNDIEREPYMAPGLVTPEKAARGKLPTDVWWHTIVPTNGLERTGYPDQKPLGILNRIILASSNPGDLVMDFFAGSGTTGESCLLHGRRFIMIDNNPQAVMVMQERFRSYSGIEFISFIDHADGKE